MWYFRDNWALVLHSTWWMAAFCSAKVAFWLDARIFLLTVWQSVICACNAQLLIKTRATNSSQGLCHFHGFSMLHSSNQLLVLMILYVCQFKLDFNIASRHKNDLAIWMNVNGRTIIMHHVAYIAWSDNSEGASTLQLLETYGRSAISVAKLSLWFTPASVWL